MSRQPRIDIGDHVYHVLNRANGRARIFHNEIDYQDFEFLLEEVKDTFDMRILAYVVMPNHWHLLLYPRKDGDLATSMRWLGTSHVRRHHERKGTVGTGHLYQGRFKSFLVEEDMHLLTVLKYIERNPVRAKLAPTAQEWRWGSAYRRISGTPKQLQLLAELPIDQPKNYKKWINDPEPSEELQTLRHSVNNSGSYGNISLSREI